MEFDDLEIWGEDAGEFLSSEDDSDEDLRPVRAPITTRDALGFDDDDDMDDTFEYSESEEETDVLTGLIDRGDEEPDLILPNDPEGIFSMDVNSEDEEEEEDAKPQAPTKPKMRLSEEQKTIATEIIENYPECATIQGSAGVGKSVLIRYCKGRLSEIHRRDDDVTNVFVVTPTGIAASNVHGRTLHSFFGLRPDDILEPDIYKVIGRLEKYNIDAVARIQDAITLIIDEISMVEMLMFEFIERLLRLIRNNDDPFGGVQMLIFGDFMQLPPISTDKNVEAMYAFESVIWKRTMKREYVLTHIFRQSGDKEYKDLLETARWGYLTPRQRALLLTRRVETHADHNYAEVSGDNEDARVVVPSEEATLTVKIHCKRDAVEKDNRRGLEGLPGRSKNYDMSVVGDVDHFYSQIHTKDSRIPARVELKVGAQVLLIRNIAFESNLVNGSIGIVTHFIKMSCVMLGGAQATAAQVQAGGIIGVTAGPVLNGESIPMVLFRGHTEAIPMMRMQWRMRETVRGKRGTSSKKDATIWQIPLVLGWACTGHKSQGMTLSSMDAYLHDAFQEGQVYVILSRVKDMKNLRLHGLDVNRICANEKALRYMKRVYDGYGKRCEALDTAIDNIDIRRFRIKKRARSVAGAETHGWVVSDTEYDSEEEYEQYVKDR